MIKKNEILKELRLLNKSLWEIKHTLYWYLEIPKNAVLKKYIQERYIELESCSEKDCKKCEIIHSELALLETRVINLMKGEQE